MSHIRTRVGIWMVGSAIGGAIVALPDEDRRVFSFSETHGPSQLDLVGVVVLVASWTPVAVVLWSQRQALRGPRARVAGRLAVVGAVALVATIGLDLGWIWLLAVAILVASQLVALHAIAHLDDPHRALP